MALNTSLWDPYHTSLTKAERQLKRAQTPAEVARIVAAFFASPRRWGIGQMFYSGYGRDVALAAQERLAEMEEQTR